MSRSCSPYTPQEADFRRFRDFLYGSIPSGKSLLTAFGSGSRASEVNPQAGDVGSDSDPLADFLFVRRDPETKQGAMIAHMSNMAYAASHEMVMVVLPRINHFLGGDILSFSNLRALTSALQLVGGVLVGAISDRTGPKAALLLSHCSAAASFFLAGFSSSLSGLYMSALPMFAVHAFQATMHVITLFSDEADRSRALGRVGALYGIGFFGGSAILIGALRCLSEQHIAIMAAGVEALLVVVIAWSFPDIDYQASADPVAERPAQEQLLRLLHRPGVARILVFKLAVTVAAGTVLNMTQQFAADPFAFSTRSTALLMSYVGGLHIVAQSLVSDRASPFGIYCVTALSVGGSLLGMAASPATKSSFVLWLAPLALSFHAANIMLGSLVTLYAPKEEMGSVLGLSVATMTLGQMISVPMAARIYHHHGFSAVACVAGGLLLSKAAAIYLLGYLPPAIEERREDATEGTESLHPPGSRELAGF